MSKSIKILTFHNVVNYGAILQCFSLFSVIKDMGADVGIINYIPTHLDKNHKKTISLRGVIFMLLSIIPKLVVSTKFKMFRHRYLVVENVDLESLSSETRVIVGSDQVWNLDLTRNDYKYFLKDCSCSKYSYAASIGGNFEQWEKNSMHITALKEFKTISVREKSDAEILTGITQKVIHSHIDPVLLHDDKWWNYFTRKSRLIRERYVLVYNLSRDEQCYGIAEELSRLFSISCIDISQGFRNKGKKYKYQRFVGPSDFLNLIRYSDYVVTDSFHGTAFSIIYRKIFYCKAVGEKGIRIKDLLSNLGLTSQLISDKYSVDYHKGLDYSDVHERLSRLRNQSFEYLGNVLSD